MTNQFELIEVPTTAIHHAYTPTKIQLEGLVEKSNLHMEEQQRTYSNKLAALVEDWRGQFSAWIENEKLWDIWHEEQNKILNRILRKKIKKPEIAYHPGTLTTHGDYIRLHYLVHQSPNKVLNLLNECNHSLTVCTYSEAVQMTPEQLNRVEYFRSGKAMQEVQEWFDNKEIS